MGISKATTDWERGDELAGDAPGDMLASLNSLVRSPAVFLKMYAFHLAAAITAFVYSALVRDPRVAIVGAGLCIRPAATWVAFSDASEAWKAVVARTARILRVAFVGYCLYLLVTSMRG